MTASFDIRNSAREISLARRLAVMNLALRDNAFLQSEAKMQFVSEAKDNFRKDDDVRWQPSGARRIAKGSPQGKRGGVHQFGVPPKTARRDSANTNPEGKPQVVSEAKDNNANFAWVQHFIHAGFNTLATLQDALLPKLLSGELTVAQTQN